MTVHKIEIIDTYKSNLNLTTICNHIGEAFDKEIQPFPIITEIPQMLSKSYNQRGSNGASIYVSDSEYIEIPANRVFLVDLILWTKPIQKFIVCNLRNCNKCLAASIAPFSKVDSSIEITFDKPNDQDNSRIDYNLVEKIAVVIK